MPKWLSHGCLCHGTCDAHDDAHGLQRQHTITVKSDDEIQDVAQAFERMRTSVSIIMKRIKEMKANR